MNKCPISGSIAIADMPTGMNATPTWINRLTLKCDHHILLVNHSLHNLGALRWWSTQDVTAGFYIVERGGRQILFIVKCTYTYSAYWNIAFLSAAHWRHSYYMYSITFRIIICYYTVLSVQDYINYDKFRITFSSIYSGLFVTLYSIEAYCILRYC